MNERGTRVGSDEGGWGEVLSGYSKDYWDLVLEQLGKRRLFQAALAVLVLLYSAAIYAPVLASDRPFVLVGADYGSYRAAQGNLLPASLGLAHLVRQGEAGYRSERTGGSTMTFVEALELERQGLSTFVGTMKEGLPAAEHGPLDDFISRVNEIVEAASAGAGEPRPGALERFADRARGLARNYRAADPTRPESEGRSLVSRVSWPLAEALSWAEVFFMVLWAFVLTWPLWNPLVNRFLLAGDRERIRRRRGAKWLVVMGSAGLAALTWAALVGGGMLFDTGPFKSGLTSGEIVARRALFPPVPYGYAEIHSCEPNRAPTWVASSELDSDGHYVTGWRVPEPDPVSGHLPPPTPVDVRHGEPGLNAPSRHLLGTDSGGRDLLVRMIWGGRISLSVGLVSAFLLTVIGTAVGAVAGYFGGWVDLLVSRLIEVFISVPAMFLIIMGAAFVDPELVPPIFSIVIIIAVVRWTGVARLARAEFLRLRESEFVLAARALGFSAPRLIFRHVLPNAMGPVLVAAAFSVAAGILTESVVSYLGFGVQEPIPSWGSLVNDSKSAEIWWIQVFPGAAIFLTVTCYNLVGEGIRDALDPKLKE